MKKPVSKVEQEIRRIQNYIKKQKKKFGASLIVDSSLSTEQLTQKYKTQKASLKYLQSLTTKVLQQKLKVQNQDTGETVSIATAHKRTRSEAQKQARESARKFYMGEDYDPENKYVDTDTGEIVITKNPMSYEGNLVPYNSDALPIKENIEINNAAEAMANTIGENWQYKEFYKKPVDRSTMPDFEYEQYAQLRGIINDRLQFEGAKRQSYNEKMRRQANFMNNWLNKLEEISGLQNVIDGLHRFLGQNSLIREDIFYRGGLNYEFAWRLAEAIDMSDADRQRLQDYLLEDEGVL